jgi:hypothetical protein
MSWYHGTPINFEHFSADYLGVGNDQLGSGFYFTDNIDTARGYAGKDVDAGEKQPSILRVELSINAPIPLEGGLSKPQIAELLKNSPQFDEAISNFGDVGWSGEEKVLAEAVDIYWQLAEGDTLRALYSIANDFWQGHDAVFLQTAIDKTGYDGVIRKSYEETHAVAWVPEQITIVERLEIELDKGMSP